MMEKHKWKIIFWLSLIPYVILTIILTYEVNREGFTFFGPDPDKIVSFVFLMIAYQYRYLPIFIPSLICQMVGFNRILLKKMKDLKENDIWKKLFYFSIIIAIVLLIIIYNYIKFFSEEGFLTMLIGLIIYYTLIGTAFLILPMCIIYQVQYIKHKKHLKETKKKEE